MGNNKFSDEEFISLLKNAVQHIQDDEDLIEISRLKHLFKKTVPFSRRSYVGSYFTKILLEQGGKIFTPQTSKNTGGKNLPPRKRFQRDEPRDRTPHYAIIDEASAAKIFISIGKNRHVFPRDLVSLLAQKTNLTQERIGEINVCDNYSFVQLFSEDADSTIAALNGCSFHGRTLTVSYARKKEDTDSADTEGAQSHDAGEYSA